MPSRQRTPTAPSPQSGSPQLGDISFDDWYETPVFEPEPEERLEHLATSRLAPLRLLGTALLRLVPTRSGRPARGERVARSEPRGPLRVRAGQLLDRWAEVETAAQHRLEERVLPERWRV